LSELVLACVPVVSDANAVGSRCANVMVLIRIGRLLYVLFSMVVPSTALSVSSAGGALVTSTVSLVAPMLSDALRVATPSAFTTRFSCLYALNPSARTSTVYTPGGSGETVYNPAEDGVLTVETFVATFVAFTLAFGTTAP